MDNFDSKCFKCVEEMRSKQSGGLGASVLAGKLSQGIAMQDLDDIHLCAKHK